MEIYILKYFFNYLTHGSAVKTNEMYIVECFLNSCTTFPLLVQSFKDCGVR